MESPSWCGGDDGEDSFIFKIAQQACADLFERKEAEEVAPPSPAAVPTESGQAATEGVLDRLAARRDMLAHARRCRYNVAKGGDPSSYYRLVEVRPSVCQWRVGTALIGAAALHARCVLMSTAFPLTYTMKSALFAAMALSQAFHRLGSDQRMWMRRVRVAGCRSRVVCHRLVGALGGNRRSCCCQSLRCCESAGSQRPQDDRR